jgi:hypothetical protein
MWSGNANGRRLVSAEWIKAATMPYRPPIQFGKLYENFLWATATAGVCLKMVDTRRWACSANLFTSRRKANVVIVKLSHWTEA